MGDHIIETQSLSKDFVRGGRSFRAVNEIDFAIDEGEFVYITGRSGSGKTTFLNLLAGLLEPSSGSVYIGGKDLKEFDDKQKSNYRNSYIGYVPQSLGTMPNLTVLENVMLPMSLYNNSKEGVGRASALLDKMGILNLKDEFPKSLSGGELKRVLLARAIMNSPKILIADEPTSDLDKTTTDGIMSVLKDINSSGTALLIVTHENDILVHSDCIYNMDDGRLVK